MAEHFEANSTEDLFRILATKNISAIRIEEDAKGAQRRQLGKRRKQSSLHYVCISLSSALIIGAALFAIYLFPLNSNTSRTRSGRPKRIKEVAVSQRKASATLSDKAIEVPHIAQPSTRSEEDKAKAEAAAAEEARLQKWKDKYAKRKSIFSNASDQLLGWLVTAKPGQGMPPLPITKSIDRDFEKSLETPIEISPDDSDEVRKVKEGVIALREQILEVKASQGLTVYEIVTQHQEIFNENATLRRKAQLEAMEIYNSGDIEGTAVYIAKMNEQLEKLGAEPLRMPGERNEVLRQHIRDRLQAIKNTKTRKDN